MQKAIRLFLFLITLLPNLIHAQILKVDKGYLASDSSDYFTGNLNLAFALNDRGSTAEDAIVYWGIQNLTDIVYIADKSASVLITGVNYFKIGEGPFIFNGYTHFRQVFRRKEKWSPEVYIQAQFDESRDLQHRWLYGGGIRWNATHPENTLYFGVGFFNERERWSIGDLSINKNLIKLNSYIGCEVDIVERVTVTGIAYYQTGYDDAISGFRDRIFASAQLKNDITDRIRMKIIFNYEFDNIPVIPLNRHVYESYLGFEYIFK